MGDVESVKMDKKHFMGLTPVNPYGIRECRRIIFLMTTVYVSK